MIAKFEAIPIFLPSRRRMRTHVAWNVPTQRSRAGAPTIFSSRDLSSAAALFVNVTARIRSGKTFFSLIRYAMRCVSTRVLPLPAPAKMSTGPSV